MKFYLRNARGEVKDANVPSTKSLTKRGEDTVREEESTKEGRSIECK
jgi:hypothetical protein